jgi:uncharacterized repeat protein (TIGR01451 family)
MKKFSFLSILFHICCAFCAQAQIVATYTPTNLMCNSDSSGIITVAPTTGTPPYQYKVNDSVWQSSNMLTSLWADTFRVYVQDALGAIDSNATVIVTQPPMLTSTIVFSQSPLCAGACDGVMQFQAAGGTPPYFYNLNNGIQSSSGFFNNLCAGTYTNTVVDVNGCTDWFSTAQVLFSPPPISVGITNVVNVACGGNAPGSFQINAFGGTGFGFTYLVYPTTSTVVSGNIVTCSVAGVYTVVATDGNGCSATGTAVVGQGTVGSNLAVAINTLGFDPCESTPSFQLLANVSPPSSTYAYSWYQASGFPSFSANDTTAVLGTYGIYNLVVTDTNGCNYPASALVTSKSLAISSTADTICSGQSVTLTDVGDSAAYPSVWYPQNAAGPSITVSPHFTTTYSLVASDSTFCADTIIKTIVVRDTAFTSTVSFVANNPTCTYANDGAIFVLSSPANNSLNYSWNNTSTASSIDSLVNGSYHVFVTQGGLCLYKEFNLIPTNTNCGTIVGNVKVDANADCIGQTTEYSISNANIQVGTLNISAITNAQGNYSITGVPFGTYAVSQVSAPLGLSVVCNASTMVTLSGTNTIVSANFVDSLSGGLDYYIGISGNPCISPFLQSTKSIYYKENIGTTTSSAIIYAVFDSISQFGSSIPVPSYFSGDTAFWNVTVGSTYSLVQLNFAVPPTSLLGTSIGLKFGYLSTQYADTVLYNNSSYYNFSVCTSFDPNDKQVYPNGVTAAGYIPKTDSVLTYTINFQNTGTAPAVNVVLRDTLSSNLNASTISILDASHPYFVTVNNGNALSFKFPNIMLPDSNANEPLSHGFITYQVHIKPNAAIGAVVNNTASIYFDYNAPVVTNTTTNTIYKPYAGSTTTSVANQICNTPCGNGSITITNNGGVTPYSYLVAPNCGSVSYTGNTIGNLAGGTFTITGVDAIGEAFTVTAIVANPIPIAISTAATAVLCNGDSSTVTISNTGGLAPYATMLNGTAVGASFVEPAGTYTLVTTDAGSCTASTLVSITQPTLLQSTITQIPISCNGGNAAVTIVATGGTAPLYVNVNGATVTGTQQLGAGTHTVLLYDAHFCMVSSTLTITEPPALQLASLSYSIAQAAYNITASATGGTGAYNYKLYLKVNNVYVLQGTYASLPITVAAPGIYKLEVYDANGCMADGILSLEPTALGEVDALVAAQAYPNPFTNTITVNIPSSVEGKALVCMLDATGRPVYAGNAIDKTLSIDTHLLASGVYWLKVGRQTIKMVK